MKGMEENFMNFFLEKFPHAPGSSNHPQFKMEREMKTGMNNSYSTLALDNNLINESNCLLKF